LNNQKAHVLNILNRRLTCGYGAAAGGYNGGLGADPPAPGQFSQFFNKNKVF